MADCTELNFYFTNLAVVWAVGAFLDAGVFAHVADLHADYRVHVEAGQLAGFDDGHAHLEVSGLQSRWSSGVQSITAGTKVKMSIKSV